MALKTKTDCFGIADDSTIICTSTTENLTQGSVEAQGEDGFVVAVEALEETRAPNCEYVVAASTASKSIVLGAINSLGTHKVALANLTITTSAGAATTISATGQQVPDDATANCTSTVTIPSVDGKFHAQDFGAFTYSGDGCHLTQCTYEVGGEIATATKDGEVVAFDLTGGKCTVSGTIVSSGSSYTKPTVTAADGWKVTQAPSETNPDADFPSYTFTLEKQLEADDK